MKFDTTLLATDLSQIPQLTRQAEAIGFDGIWVSETAHDTFLPLVLAAEHSQRVSLAHIGWDLARFSKGRFIIGLGTQVNNHFQ